LTRVVCGAWYGVSWAFIGRDTAVSEGGRRFCENCGAGISQSANFCPNCGTAQHRDLEEPAGPLAEEPTGPLVEEPRSRTIGTPKVASLTDTPPKTESGRIGVTSAPEETESPEQPEQPRNSRFRNIMVIVGVVILVLIVARALGGEGTSKQASGRTFTKANYAELATDPASFRGASVDVEGKLLGNPEVKNDRTHFQMWADPENVEWNTVVHTDDPPSGLTRGDQVRVKGTVQGEFTGENAFGAKITAPEVKADSVSITKQGDR
jgi:hypothetical protein